MNEAERGSGKAVVKKTWAERLSEEPELESDTDEQLLMHIPYVMHSKAHDETLLMSTIGLQAR